MDIHSIIIIISLFYFSLTAGIDWRDYPTCKIGRLQSPIKIKEYESIYANNFSFVYQSYKSCKKDKVDGNYAHIIYYCKEGGGYINFERGGVIKQYEFIRAELYPALHEVDGEKGEYELHLIHKKNLDFVTNKNQYRSIQDPNMYLVIVLRYQECGEGKACTYDNGLLKQLNEDSINLGTYNIFQDKRAYFYEGSFVRIPCDENVNYYIVKDFFHYQKNDVNITNPSNENVITINNFANIFGRPVYKNFMNYREVLESHHFSFKNALAFLFIIIFI